MTRWLVTGGAGFIGSNFVRLLLADAEVGAVTNLDALTYAGVRQTVEELDCDQRHRFIHGDIADMALVDELMAEVDVEVHFAAESMVDRSIGGGRVFLETNIIGTDVLLEAALRHRVKRFIHVSTDEVYGSWAEGAATETDTLNPSSAYSASKAASDHLVRSYFVTHGLPVIITRCTNNYGPYQFPEKVIPLFITNLLEGNTVPLYGDGSNERDWLYVTDHCHAIMTLLEKGVPGEIYNIGADNQLSNLELTQRILGHLDLPHDRIERVPDRLGHDLRYAVDSTKVRQLGWAPRVSFDEGLEKTIDWYRQRRDWWEPLKERRL